MSYRNPQQYGIVEDMTAGTRAFQKGFGQVQDCLLYTSPSPRDRQKSRMPSSA